MNLISFTLAKNGRDVRLITAYKVVVRGHKIEVPAGFVSDFASVPRIFWRVVPPWGRYSTCAVVHDWLYFAGGLERKECDLIFLELMKRADVPAWKRGAIYMGVRIGGWRSWNRHRETGI